MAKAKVRFEDVKPGTARLRGEYETQRRGAIAVVACWWALAAFGLGISAYTFFTAEAGGRFVLWWGPVVLGVWRAIRAHGELRRIDVAFRKQLERYT